jgi:polysaccharide biosynthesis/export protein
MIMRMCSFKNSVIAVLSLFFLVILHPDVQGQGTERSVRGGVNEDYLLGAGDIVEVSAWRNEDLSKVVVVRPDGRISLPLIGEIKAAGLTPLELRDKIIVKLQEFGETPEATIIVNEINSYVVYLLGEVVRPGRFQLNARTTIVQAIAMAGGLSEFASANKIVLLRKIEGKDEERRTTINFNDIISGKMRNVWLQPWDTLIIP